MAIRLQEAFDCLPYEILLFPLIEKETMAQELPRMEEHTVDCYRKVLFATRVYTLLNFDKLARKPSSEMLRATLRLMFTLLRILHNDYCWLAFKVVMPLRIVLRATTAGCVTQVVIDACTTNPNANFLQSGIDAFNGVPHCILALPTVTEPLLTMYPVHMSVALPRVHQHAIYNNVENA